MSNYEKDIAEYWKERMPQEINKLSHRASADLYFGPTYYDEEDDEVTCFDEGATQFNFLGACKKISDWCDDNMYTLYMEPWCGMLEPCRPEQFEEVETEYGDTEVVELEVEYYEWSVRDQMKIVFGELAKYL